jgi:hypothetical protein
MFQWIFVKAFAGVNSMNADERETLQRSQNKRAAVERAIRELKAIGAEIDEFLRRGREAIHKNMKEVAPGIWIHQDYPDLRACLLDLKKMLPTA